VAGAACGVSPAEQRTEMAYFNCVMASYLTDQHPGKVSMRLS